MTSIWVFFWFFASAYEPSVPSSAYIHLPAHLAKLVFVFDVRDNPHYLAAIVTYYITAMFLATFFNVAFYHETMRTFAGDEPSVSRGLVFAGRRVLPILTWSLFAGSIGVVLRLLANRFGWLGKISASILGFTWSVAAVFTIPVLVRDGTIDPIQLLRHSGNLVKKTWGNLVYGLMRLYLIPAGVTALFFLSIFLLMPALMLAGGPLWWIVTGWSIILAIILIFMMLSQLIGNIYHCALYIYATEGVIPGEFSKSDMDARWRINGS